MNRGILVIAMLALLPAFSLAPNVAAETVDATCATVTVLTEGDLDGEFSSTACGLAVSYAALRNPTTSEVSWTVETDMETRTCTWPADGATECSGTGPVPASQGSTYTVTISADAGDVVFSTYPSAAV